MTLDNNNYYYYYFVIIWERAAVAAAGALDKVFVHVIDDIHDALELDLTAFEC